MFIEPMAMTLDAYIKRIDNENGIGAYNTLLVLCRLALCLVPPVPVWLFTTT